MDTNPAPVHDTYEHYTRWAIAPLMTREQWEASRRRLDEMAAAGTLPTNPYEW